MINLLFDCSAGPQASPHDTNKKLARKSSNGSNNSLVIDTSVGIILLFFLQIIASFLMEFVEI